MITWPYLYWEEQPKGEDKKILFREKQNRIKIL